LTKHIPLLVVLAMLLVCGWGGAVPAPLTNALVLADDGMAAADALEAAGGQAYHIFDHAVIGFVPPGVELGGQGTVRSVVREPMDAAAASRLAPDAQAAAEAWNHSVWGKEIGLPAWLRGMSRPKSLGNDAKRVPLRGESLGLVSYRKGAAPPGAGRYNTSEFMMGRVAVGLWLPESAGAGENWSLVRQNQVIAQVQAGVEWWRLRTPSAKLSFVYEINRDVPVSLEPIASTEESTWVNECMATRGYHDADAFENVYSYNNALRDSKSTDWGFALFVVDSLNDADGEFPDGYFAYAYLGGPWMVMTYDNDGYGIEEMDAVMAHEMGHIFYALDEYLGQQDDASARSGYFNEVNGNYEGGAIINVSCIMRGGTEAYPTGSVCPYTFRHIGHRDYNGNNIQDILDVAPTCQMPPYAPDPSSNPIITYSGSAQVGLLSNLNPQRPDHEHPAITINTIATVECRVDGGLWSAATAKDGAFNSGQEEFTITLGLAAGTHKVEARAKDTSNNVSNVVEDSVTLTKGLPMVTATYPLAGASDVPSDAKLTATFSNDMDPDTINANTFKLVTDKGAVTGSVSYDPATRTATFAPSRLLLLESCVATLVGGTNGIKDPDGLALFKNYTWSFTVPKDVRPPYLEVTAPTNNAVVGGLVTISAEASDAMGMDRVEFFVDNVNTVIDRASPYQAAWDTTPLSVADGPHSIMVWAFDSDGHKSSATITVQADNSTFDDVIKGSSYWPYVEAIYREGVASGCSYRPRLFCPGTTVSRAMMAMFLCRAMGRAPLMKPVPSFSDVPPTSPYYGYIEAMRAAGVMQGCGGGKFCPDIPVTRGLMAAFLCRARGWPTYDKPVASFADVAKGTLLYGYVEAVYLRGIVQGCALRPLQYCPNGIVTRGQMTVFLCRAFGFRLF